MTLAEAEKDLYDAIQIVGSKKDNFIYPWEVEKVLILPCDETDLNVTLEVIRLLNSSSNAMVKVLKDHGYSKRDFDYYVYTGIEGISSSTSRIMKLNDYIKLT